MAAQHFKKTLKQIHFKIIIFSLNTLLFDLLIHTLILTITPIKYDTWYKHFHIWIFGLEILLDLTL